MKKRLSKAEYERIKQIKITAKNQPETDCRGWGNDIEVQHYSPYMGGYEMLWPMLAMMKRARRRNRLR